MIALVLGALLPTRLQTRTLVIEGYRPATEAVVSKNAMRYLPFEVPAGVVKIDVRKELDFGPSKAGGIADLGLFDPRGYGPGAPGFRGWQGGAGDGFTLTEDPATTSPWYLPGPIRPGTWWLAQYFLRSSPEGLKYRYRITLTMGAPSGRSPRMPQPDRRRLSEEARYYAGNLHCHSLHSDGGRTLTDVAKWNQQAGFDYVVSTEHNTPAAIYEFPSATQGGPLLIVGTELTMPGGHAGILGHRPGSVWDFRCDPGDGGLAHLMNQVRRERAVFVINHPFATCTTCTWRYPQSEWQSASGVEVWNSMWSDTNEKALTWWDSLLRQGYRLNAYGGTDYHRGNDPLMPATWTFAKGLGTPAVMDGLRQGHTILSDSARARHLQVQLNGHRPGDEVPTAANAVLEIGCLDAEPYTVKILDQNGVVESYPSTTESRRSISLDLRSRRFLRVELRDPVSGRMRALSNPFWIGRRSPDATRSAITAAAK